MSYIYECVSMCKYMINVRIHTCNLSTSLRMRCTLTYD